MTPRRAPTPSADPERAIPESRGGRLDRIDAAIASLREEERRVARLGLEIPMARCREQRRYWEFLRSLFTIEAESRIAPSRRGGRS